MSVWMPCGVPSGVRVVPRVDRRMGPRVPPRVDFLRVRVPFRLLSVFNALSKPWVMRVQTVLNALSNR